MKTRKVILRVTDDEYAQMLRQAGMVVGCDLDVENQVARACLGLPLRQRGQSVGRAGRKPATRPAVGDREGQTLSETEGKEEGSAGRALIFANSGFPFATDKAMRSPCCGASMRVETGEPIRCANCGQRV